ncbi:MAG: glycosyltransferase [Acidimicrobiaceae bacterium]|nr:glycosyltransferase [Acidimicrobiia bacterium]MCY4495270.1 glycosyltransferase [Acidimicrobiaceae bacterium]
MSPSPDSATPPARRSEAGPALIRRPGLRRFIADRSLDMQAVFTAVVVAGVTLFVVWNLSPWLWFTDTTPTGGDLGAHVWSPAYLRDELLPDLRLTGWSPDWYAGFPAFTFYMVVPSLLIVMVNVGLDLPLDLLSAFGVAVAAFVVAGRFGAERSSRLIVAAGFGAGSALFGAAADGRVFITDWLGWSPLEPFTFNDTSVDLAIAAVLAPAAVGVLVWSSAAPARQWRGALTAAAVAATVLTVPTPYGVAMKLVVIAGIVALPLSAFVAGRLSGLAFPGPALMALMTLPFIFDRSFNIYGGNLMSTMAGEFAYSLGLSVAMLFIGFAARGLASGSDRVAAAVLLALIGLLHLFAAFFALVALFALLVVRFGRREVFWVGVVGPVAALLAAFWVLPFAWNVAYLNDMGWGKERRYAAALWHRGDDLGNQSFLANDLPLQVFVVLAVVGVLVCVLRRVRIGIALGIVAAVFAAAFVLLPESRLWNVRILPFYYLSVYLLSGIAVAEVGRGAIWMLRPAPLDSGGSGARPPAVWAAVPAGLLTLVILTALAFPLRSVPFATTFQRTDAAGGAATLYGFSSIFGIESIRGWNGLATAEFNQGPGWLRYNFTGYEQKSGTVEYNELVSTMAEVGEEFGCGRSLWEFDSERLGTYGTTMAPMLLPHWTDGCIGSMEGLYFEASATTPYHFLLQSELSESPSRAQRDLPYSRLDVGKGVGGLETLGVRYYLAVSESAIAQARELEAFEEIAASGPWVVFLVKDQQIAVGLEQLPVVIEGLSAGGEHWLVPTVAAWESAEEIPLIAADGPAGWPRMSLDDLARQDADFAASVESGERVSEMRALADLLPDWLERVPTETAEVFDLAVDNDSISFSVDRIGFPVLVRASYFPNWEVSGADGPFRVAPNLMVVVPTETSVSLSYTRSAVQWIGLSATLLGLVLAVAAARRRWDRGDDGPPAFWDLAAPRAATPSRPATPEDAADVDYLPDPVPVGSVPVPAYSAATSSARGSAGLGDPIGELRLSVVVPAYCEAERIASTVAEIRSELDSLHVGGDLEIVVVDDGSPDDTARRATEAGADLVIELPANQGKGAAVRAGVLASRGRTVAFTDADLAYSPDQLLGLLAVVEAGCEVVIGNRYAELSVADRSVSGLRRLGSRAVNLFARTVLAGRYRDTQCGCKAFRADVAKALMAAGRIDGFAFDVELLHLAERCGYAVAEVPVRVVNSESSTVRAFKDGLRVARDVTMIRRLSRSGVYASSLDCYVVQPRGRG